MEDNHNSCNGERVPPKNPHFIYLGTDFFNQILDNCNSAGGTAVYKKKENEPSLFSYPVVAFDSTIKLTDFEVFNKKRRPLTKQEAAAVAKEKDEFKQGGSDCSTNPSFLDEANILLTAKVQGSNTSIRLSKYETPGCEGHMAAYYILDVIEDGVLIKKYELIQYIGLI
jgi:hypothetical protein